MLYRIIPYYTVLQPRSITKTSSGKIARQKVRKAYLEGGDGPGGGMSVVAQWSALLDGQAR